MGTIDPINQINFINVAARLENNTLLKFLLSYKKTIKDRKKEMSEDE